LNLERKKAINTQIILLSEEIRPRITKIDKFLLI